MSRKKSYFTIFLGVPERIKKIRGGLTQAQFAHRLGVTQGTVQKYEKGEILPSDAVQNKIAAFGGITVDWLLHGDESRARPALSIIEEHAPDEYTAARPAEIQEFLFVEVYQVVSAYACRKKYDQLRLARLLVRVYNHCVENLDRPSELLCEKYDPSIP